MSKSTPAPTPTLPDGTPLELPWPQPSGTWSTYNLHCHCGSIRYNIKLSPPLYTSELPDPSSPQYPVGSCDCSFCQRNGYLCIHPLAENIEFTQGLEHKAEYLFGEKKNPQWFCKRCGSVIATDIRPLMEMMGQEARFTVNARMLKDFDIDRLKIKEIKGMKDMGRKYDPDTLESEVR